MTFNTDDKNIDFIIRGTVQSQHYDGPVVTAADLGIRHRKTAKRVCTKCPNKLSSLNSSDLCHACQVVERRRNLNGPIVVQKRRRPHADTI